jgi:hypothetical protein
MKLKNSISSYVILFAACAAVLIAACGGGGGGGDGDGDESNGIKLTASDAEDDDFFGWSVSISGDFAIVGAWDEDGAGTDRGAAYVFYRNHGGTDTWGEVTKFTASDAEDGDYFGGSVSISGDYAIVGAAFEDGAGADRGAAYVFNQNQGGTDMWGQVAKLTASDAGDGDWFGHSVSISGDYAIVGAWREDGVTNADRGAAYVFYRNQGGTDSWGQVAKLTASDAYSSDYFGCSVSISGDDAIVGAYAEDGTGFDRGAAYVFNRNQGGTDAWGEVAKLSTSSTEDSVWFGYSVSMSGDDAIVGAHYAGSTDHGAAHVFSRNQGGTDAWGKVATLYAADWEDYDQFGISVSLSGDLAIVGADGEDGPGIDRGAAYMFQRNQGGTDAWGQVAKVIAADVQNDERNHD